MTHQQLKTTGEMNGICACIMYDTYMLCHASRDVTTSYTMYHVLPVSSTSLHMTNAAANMLLVRLGENDSHHITYDHTCSNHIMHDAVSCFVMCNSYSCFDVHVENMVFLSMLRSEHDSCQLDIHEMHSSWLYVLVFVICHVVML